MVLVGCRTESGGQQLWNMGTAWEEAGQGREKGQPLRRGSRENQELHCDERCCKGTEDLRCRKGNYRGKVLGKKRKEDGIIRTVSPLTKAGALRAQ